MMLIFMGLPILLGITPNTFFFEIFRMFILCSYGVLIISFLYFFISVIYYQFKDKRTLWGIINVLLLISFIWGREDDWGILVIIILLVSCSIYNDRHILPKFAKKTIKNRT